VAIFQRRDQLIETRARERERNQFYEERSRLIDRIANMKGYRDYAPNWQPVPPVAEVETEEEVEEGFLPFTV